MVRGFALGYSSKGAQDMHFIRLDEDVRSVRALAFRVLGTRCRIVLSATAAAG